MKMVKVRGVERKKVYVQEKARQRGTGKEIRREDAIVFDFMPVLLGNEFRTDDILSKLLFRDSPVNAPFMLSREAYTLQGERYLKKKAIVPALECYKFALKQQTSFIRFISSIGDSALLTPVETSHLELGGDLETSLMKELSGSNGKRRIDIEEYTRWLESLRELRTRFHTLNKRVYSLNPFHMWEKEDGVELGFDEKTKKWIPIRDYSFSDEFKDCARDYVEVCVKLGDFKEALNFARYLGEPYEREIRTKKPREILDVKWLKKYVDKNHPETSMFG